MDLEEFRRHGHALVDWMADYLASVEGHPVRAQVRPGAIAAQLPAAPPVHGEPLEEIFADFERILLPGMTHWQHPSFFAYFPANSSPPSVLAEMLTATLGAQCMLWQTSPAATELETRTLDWLRQMIGLPEGFAGVIQDSASSATLCAILVGARAGDRLAGEREWPWRLPAARLLRLRGGALLGREGDQDRRARPRQPAPGPDRCRLRAAARCARCGRFARTGQGGACPRASSRASARPGSAPSIRCGRSARSAASTASFSTSMPPGPAARSCWRNSAG